jgi:hypothetical protein
MFRRRQRDEGKIEDEELAVEAEAKAVDADLPEDVTADLESQAADYLAGNELWMYGPNAEEVMAILDQLEEIGPEQAEVIAAAWNEIPKSDRDRARRSVTKFYERDAELARHIQTAREEVSTWLSIKSGYPEYVAASEDWGKLAARCADAANDAVTALILDEKLEDAHYDALITPWTDAIERLEREGRLEHAPASPNDPLELDDQEIRFGPNGQLMTDFLNRLWMLAPDQIALLVSGWQELSKDDLKKAHEHLKAVVDESDEYRDQVRKAQSELGEWLNSGRIEETAGFLGQAGQGESRRTAGPTLADAVAALVLGDLLDPEDAQLLYSPWFKLIGAPALPEPAEKPAKKAAPKAAKPAAKPAPAKPATKAAPKDPKAKPKSR